MAELDDLSITDASNTARFPENMQFRDVNDSARALEGMIARELKDRNMSLVASGSANAFAVTTNRTIISLADGLVVGFTANHTISSSPTLNVNGLGAKTIVSQTGTALSTGDIVSGQKLLVAYRSATADWQVVGGRAAGSSADVVARIIPVGTVLPWPGSTAPPGYLLAYGQAVSRTTYAELFTAYGTTYGAGDGSTTFNLPDYRGRAPFGRDDMGGAVAGRITAAGSSITGTTLGATGGAQSVTLTTAQIPSHGHTATVTDPGHFHAQTVTTDGGATGPATGGGFSAYAFDGAQDTGSKTTGITVSNSSTGGGGAHTNMPPAIIQNWIILALPALASAATTGVNGLLYQFSNSTSGAPGDGKLAFDHATISSATGFRISETDATGAPMGPVLATWDDSTSTVRGTLYVYKVGTLSTYAVFQVTGTMTDSGAYDSFSATYVSANGTFADGDQLSVIYVPKGDKGDVGAGLDWQGAWLTATAYALADGVSNGGSSYIATSAHTSGSSTEPGVGASWATVWNVIAAKGTPGAGTGDMLGANNLSDVTNASTAFNNIKQAASDTATGVVELATNAEAVTGTDTGRAVTPAGLTAHVDAAALTFRTIAVSGQSDVVADSRTDTLTLAAGSNITITTNAGTDTVTIASAGGSGIAGNNVVNPSMRIAQQGTTFTSTSTPANNDDTYTLDGWYILADGADTIDVTQSTEAPTGGLNSIALDVETANRKFGIAQIIEQKDCLGYIGATVTLSFYAKVSAVTNLDNVKCAIVAWSGTADTVTSDIISAWGTEGTNPTLIANATYENTPASLGVTTSWARYSVSAAVDTASAKNIILLIWSDVTTTSVGGADILYITDVKLEVGSTATTFETPNYVHDLLRCQRFYWRWGYENADSGTGFRMFGYSTAGTSEGQTIKHPVQMRAVPTMTKVGTWTVSNCGQPIINDVSTISATTYVVVTASSSFDFYPNTTGYLEADARL